VNNTKGTTHLTLHQALGWQAKLIGLSLFSANMLMISVSYFFDATYIFKLVHLETITPNNCNEISYVIANSTYFVYSRFSLVVATACIYIIIRSMMIKFRLSITMAVACFVLTIPFFFLNFTDRPFFSPGFISRTCEGSWSNILYLFQMAIFPLASFYIFGLASLVARINRRNGV